MKWLNHIAMILLLAGAASVRAEVVSSIEGPGLSKEERTSLANQLGIVVGRNLDANVINRAIQQLYNRGRYERILVQTETSNGGLRVVLSTERFRKVKGLRFVNVSEAILSDLKSRVDYSEGKITSRNDLEMLRARLLGVYETQGYFGAKVGLNWGANQSSKSDTEINDVEVVATPGARALIGRVIVTGGTAEENALMLEAVTLKKGEPFIQRTVDDNVQKINQSLQANNYPTSRVEETQFKFNEERTEVGVNFVLRMGEKYRFEFSGNTVFENVVLRELLTSDVLSQSDAASRVSELLEQKYKSVGYHFCKVRVASDSVSKENLHIVRFEIQEGEKVLIDQIHFSGGVGELTKDDLIDIFINNAPGVIKRRIYWAEGMPEAVKNLGEQLNRRGYLNVSLAAPRVAFSADQKGVELFFEIELGVRTRVSMVEVTGAKALTPEQVQETMDLKVGDVFDRAKVIEGRQKLVTRYQSLGYLDVKYADNDKDNGVTLSRDGKLAKVDVPVEEGKKYYVGSIILDGNRKTQDKVILREFLLKPGDVYDPALVRQSEEKINTLGLFQRLEIVPSNSPGSNDKKDIRIVLRETPPGLGEVGFGGFYEDPRLRMRSFLGLAYRNLLGLNQTVSGRTEVALPFSRSPNLIPFVEYSGSIGYRAPYPLEIPVTFTGQFIFDSYEVANLDATQVRLQSRTKVEGRLEKKFSPRFTALYRLYQLERTVTEILNDSSSISIDVIGSTGPGIILDFRDDLYNPTKGSLHSINLEVASPALLSAKDISFYMMISRNSFYVPLVASLDLAFSLSLGYAESLFAGKPIPAARLANDLALGGRGSIRGFNVGIFSPIPNGTNGIIGPVTRTAFYNGRAELGIPFAQSYKLAFFYDTGQIFPNMAPQDRQDGIGFGLRYKIPVGPISVDFARGLGPRGEFKFYFTIGTL